MEDQSKRIVRGLMSLASISRRKQPYMATFMMAVVLLGVWDIIRSDAAKQIVSPQSIRW